MAVACWPAELGLLPGVCPLLPGGQRLPVPLADLADGGGRLLAALPLQQADRDPGGTDDQREQVRGDRRRAGEVGLAAVGQQQQDQQQDAGQAQEPTEPAVGGRRVPGPPLGRGSHRIPVGCGRSDSQGSDSQAGDSRTGDSEGRRVDLASEPAQEQPPPAESLPHEAGADSGLSPGDSDQAKAPADDPGTDDHPLRHFHADFKGAHYDWYLPGPDTQPTIAETGDAAPAERAGDLIANLDDVKRPRTSELLREFGKEAENIPDAGRDLGDLPPEFLARPSSSAHAVVEFRPTMTQLAHGETDTGNAVTGLALLTALILRATQSGIDYWRHRKDAIGDQHRAGDRAPDTADREPR